MIRQFLLSLSLFCGALCLHASTMDSLRAVVCHDYVALPVDDHAGGWVKTLRPDGSWPDIDYADQSRSFWQLEKHLDRISAIALYARQCGKAKEQTRARQAAVAALRYWFAGGFTNPNWWYQKIGMPRRLLAIAYQLDDSLPADLRPLMAKALAAIDSDDYPARPGGDRIQVISNHAKALLWQGDETSTVRLFAKLEAEAQFGQLEETMYDAAGGLEVRNGHRPAGRGFQRDRTFHHRGDRVDCTLTYGMEVPEFFSQWALMLRRTPWRFSDEHVRFIIDYVLDAVRWHLVGDTYAEPSALNRELARPNHTEFHHAAIVDRLLTLCDGYRRDELLAFQRADTHPVGCRYFWQSGYFVFKSEGYETAVRMHSERNANQEYPHNSEAIRNHFRGDGACHLSVSGREYDAIWPVFDFSRVPGTTSPLLSEMPPMNEVQLRRSPMTFAGGVTDGTLGACAMDFKTYRNDLRARKSWFFFPEGYLCLGSGISSSLPDTIVTTVEQSLLPRHGRYTVIDGGRLIESEGTRHGAWSHVVRGAEHETLTASRDVYALSIDHGVRPVDASYAYAVAPLSTPADARWYEIVHHDNVVHAVRSTDETVLFCVFFEPGSVTTSTDVITVGEPCILMLRDGRRYIMDPTHGEYQLHVSITPRDEYAAQGDRSPIAVRIPTWQYAGTTVEF